MPKWRRLMMPLGMLGALCYVAMIFLGQALWKEYDPVTTFVSHLTAIGSPNGPLMRLLTNFHGLLVTLFTLAAYLSARERSHKVTRWGYALLLIMAALMFAAFALCPLKADEPSESLRNMTHFVVTVVCVALAIVAIGLIGEGYRRAGRALPGTLCVCAATLIALAGGFAVICMDAWPEIVGLAQRVMIFALEGFIFFLSLAHTLTAFR